MVSFTPGLRAAGTDWVGGWVGRRVGPNAVAKVKLSLCLTKHHTMKAYWGGGIAPRILDLGTRRMHVVSFTLLPLYPLGKSARYHLVWGGGVSRSGCGAQEKRIPSLPLSVIEPRSSSPQPVLCTDCVIRTPHHV
jgi:hypothetical protein